MWRLQAGQDSVRYIWQRLWDHKDWVWHRHRSRVHAECSSWPLPFKGRSDPVFHFIEKCSTEGVTEIIIIKVFDMTPETVITVAAFGKKAVNMRIPFEIPAECMKDHDIAGSVIFGMVQVEKHS